MALEHKKRQYGVGIFENDAVQVEAPVRNTPEDDEEILDAFTNSLEQPLPKKNSSKLSPTFKLTVTALLFAYLATDCILAAEKMNGGFSNIDCLDKHFETFGHGYGSLFFVFFLVTVFCLIHHLAEKEEEIEFHEVFNNTYSGAIDSIISAKQEAKAHSAIMAGFLSGGVRPEDDDTRHQSALVSPKPMG